MRKLLSWAVVSSFVFVASPAYAWFNGGHMVVAYIAYQNLTPQIRSRVDALIRRNNLYAKWTKGVPKKQKGLVAFMKAATWPDCIKQQSCIPGYTSDGGNIPPGKATDAQNIGYEDKLMHRYWHFIDIPYSAGAPGQPPKVPNAQTEILMMTQAIGSSQSEDVKSYDVVWLEHLVGDVHQPLHSISRFTKNHPNGDAGGNFVRFCSKPCMDELHAYWDGLLGDTPTITQVIKTSKSLLATEKPAGAGNTVPSSWIEESFDLARAAVYVAPISDDNSASDDVSLRPDRAYQSRATGVARAQVKLAGYRLAALLNNNLK
jgi:hypothetical protein